MSKADKVDKVIVEYMHLGKPVQRVFTPETVNPKNPHHKGKTHADLANEFVESNAAKHAKIVDESEVSTEGEESEGGEEGPAPVAPLPGQATGEETVSAPVAKPAKKGGAKKAK